MQVPISFMDVFIPGLAIMALILIFRAIQVGSYLVGAQLGKKRAYGEEFAKLKAERDWLAGQQQPNREPTPPGNQPPGGAESFNQK